MIQYFMVNIFAAVNGCTGSFFGFPTWYHYLLPKNAADCTPRFNSISDIWLVVAACIEILLRVGSLIAIGYIIWGGFDYITSQAEPDKTNKARQTIINAIVGLVISILAAVIVNFVAGSIK